MNLIEVTQSETVALMKEASPPKYLALAFGPGFVAIRAKHSPWAVERLKELRAPAESSAETGE